MPPVVRAGDDILHVAKLAVAAPLPHAVYVVDENNRYVGMIPEGRLEREIFEHLNPSLYLDRHPHGTTGLFHLKENASNLKARALMDSKLRPLQDQETIAGAMRELHHTAKDELPVISADKQFVGIIRALDILREWVEDTLLVQLGDETESFY